MLDTFRKTVTSKAGLQLLAVKKNSPVLMFGVGVVGFGATIYLSSRATLKMDGILKEGEAEKDRIAAGAEEGSEERKKAGVAVRINTAMKIAKVYSPAFVVGVITVAALTGSHVTLTRRNAGLTAAYVALDKGFREYRARVVEELGADKDTEFRYGTTDVQIAEDQPDGGVEVKDMKQIKQIGSIYARIFDKGASRHWDSAYGENQRFISSQQTYANNLLDSRGYVFLNEIYESLGLPHTTAGSQVGWVSDKHRGFTTTGDGRIDFGVFTDPEGGKNFVNMNERSVLLDFNVDGPIFHRLDEINQIKALSREERNALKSDRRAGRRV